MISFLQFYWMVNFQQNLLGAVKKHVHVLGLHHQLLAVLKLKRLCFQRENQATLKVSMKSILIVGPYILT